MSGSNVMWTFDGRKLPANPYEVFIRTCGNFAGPENLVLTEFDESPWVKDDALDCFYTASMQWAPAETWGAFTCKIQSNTLGWPEGASIIPGVGDGQTTGLVRVNAADGRYEMMPNPQRWKALMAGTFWGFDPVKRELIFVTGNSIRHVAVDGADAPRLTKEIDYGFVGTRSNTAEAVSSTNLASTQFACDWIGRKLYFYWPEAVYTPGFERVLRARVRVMSYALDWPVAAGNTQGGITYSGGIYSETSPWRFMADPPVGPKPGSPNSASWLTAPNGIVGVLLFDTRKRKVLYPELRDGYGVCFSVNVLDPVADTWTQPYQIPQDDDGVPLAPAAGEVPGGTYLCYDEGSAALLTCGIIFNDNPIPAVDAWEQQIKTKALHWVWRG